MSLIFKNNKGVDLMYENKIYTTQEMQRDKIITTDYKFMYKEAIIKAELILKAEASNGMTRLFFITEDGEKIITPVFWWQEELGFETVDVGSKVMLNYVHNNKDGIHLESMEVLSEEE